VVVPVVLALALPALAFRLWPAALVFVVLAAFMAYFFRDPKRVSPTEAGLIVSPADGRITLIQRSEVSGGGEGKLLVSIFLSPLDVHINRAPVAGTITDITYAKGRFLMATNSQASALNEQNTLTIQGDKLTVVCKQIAGILARRIVCWKKVGDTVQLGERFGMIKFGSRTDLIFSSSVELLVSEGMHVRGGETVIARVR
jgi:phosphatidylserine decarboxylase